MVEDRSSWTGAHPHSGASNLPPLDSFSLTIRLRMIGRAHGLLDLALSEELLPKVAVEARITIGDEPLRHPVMNPHRGQK